MGSAEQETSGSGVRHFSDVSALKSSVHESTSGGILARWNAKIENLAGLEVRGITRVLPEERHAVGGWPAYQHMFMLWFGMNLCALVVIPGFFGPLVFNLGWVDCVCIVIFASALGSCGPAYMATFGPVSGCRSMVSACRTRSSAALSTPQDGAEF